MGCNVFYGRLNRGDLISLRVRDLNGELILESHHYLTGVEGIEVKVLEGGVRGDSRSIYLIYMFKK